MLVVWFHEVGSSIAKSYTLGKRKKTFFGVRASRKHSKENHSSSVSYIPFHPQNAAAIIIPPVKKSFPGTRRAPAAPDGQSSPLLVLAEAQRTQRSFHGTACLFLGALVSSREPLSLPGSPCLFLGPLSPSSAFATLNICAHEKASLYVAMRRKPRPNLGVRRSFHGFPKVPREPYSNLCLSGSQFPGILLIHNFDTVPRESSFDNGDPFPPVLSFFLSVRPFCLQLLSHGVVAWTNCCTGATEVVAFPESLLLNAIFLRSQML